MYSIVGKPNLWAINEIANKAIQITYNIENIPEEVTAKNVAIDKNDLANLASGFLFLYNKTLEKGIMPDPKLSKHSIETIH